MTDPGPMTCDEALRQLAAFLDGEVPAPTREAMERHLERCRGCFSRAEFERRLKTELGRLGREDAADGFEERVRRLLGSFVAPSAAESSDRP